LLPAALVTLLGRDLFVVVFGEEWAEAGVYAQILAPWTFFWFVSSPLTVIFAVLERLGLAFVVHISLFTSRVLPLVVGGRLGDVTLALVLFSFANALTNAGLAAWNLHLAGVNWSTVVKGLTPPVALAALFTALVALAKAGGLPAPWCLGVGVVCLVAYYGIFEFRPLYALYRRVRS